MSTIFKVLATAIASLLVGSALGDIGYTVTAASPAAVLVLCGVFFAFGYMAGFDDGANK